MPKKVRMCVPIKIEVKIRARPFKAIFLARAVRPRLDSPRVNDKKIGVLPIGLTIGNNAPITRRVFFTRSLRAPCIIDLYTLPRTIRPGCWWAAAYLCRSRPAAPNGFEFSASIPYVLHHIIDDCRDASGQKP